MNAKPATRKGRPQQWDRDAILLAARAVTVDRGFDGLRFADVAAATSVPVSSLQYAFGSRDDLVREVLRAGVNDEFARLESAVGEESDPWQRIEIFVRRGISLDDQVRREGWLLWIEYWRASLRDDVVREDYARVASSWRALVRDAIDGGVAAGEFSLKMSSDEAAAVVVAIVDGLGLQIEVGGRLVATQAIAAARIAVAALLGVNR